jgi:UDP-N-acetylmuramoylalanine--D-glutamate ligase
MTHVLVVGLRATGLAVARHCAARGDRLTVVEDDPGHRGYDERAREVRALGATLVERPAGDVWAGLVAAADLVVPSPGVRPGHPVFAAATAAGTPVRGDIDLGVEAAMVPVVAVTGTNGKSTVTTLTAAMLEASGVRAVAAGNIGRPLLEVVGEPWEVVVAEVSSFQLHTTTEAFRPRVAVLLNVADDHLDWHGSPAAYTAVKAKVFGHQRGDDVLVANVEDPTVAALAATAPARVVPVALDGGPGTFRAAGGALRTPDGEPIAPLATLPQRSPHDLTNALCAAAAALAVGANRGGVRRALEGFTRLHHRVEPVGKASGVQYVDDSKATNPHATLSALEGFERVVLLAGGDSKGVDLGVLARAKDRLRAVVAIGDTPDEVERALGGAVPTVRATSMGAAVRTAADLAEPGDTVLLSPACASFDWYDGYEARGDDFRAEVRRLLDRPDPLDPPDPGTGT